jgi:general secretion pathway protein G
VLNIDVWKKSPLIALALVGLAWLGVEMFVPREVTSPRENREGILRQDLFTMNQILSQYTLDNHKHPQSLDDLVAAGYLKRMPTDPTTGRSDTWVLEWSDDPKMPGIIGIRSASGPSK